MLVTYPTVGRGAGNLADPNSASWNGSMAGQGGSRQARGMIAYSRGLWLRRDRSAGTDENRARGRSSSAIRLFASGDARVLLRAGTLLELLFSPGMDYPNDRDAIGLGWRILPDERSFDVRSAWPANVASLFFRLSRD